MASDEREIAWLLKEKYGGVESPGFFADRERLAAGEPLAYVIGWQPFLDVKISLDSKPLIPRPETEYWGGLAIAAMATSFEVSESRRAGSVDISKLLKVLDLCAGSGAIGVAVAKAFPAAHVDFAELDAQHHATITNNICDNGIDYSQTRIFGGDLFEQIPRGTRYDFILTNPPYIDPALDRAEESVKAHEPHLALYGGARGMALIARIVEAAPEYLARGGQLWIEHEPEQAGEIAALSKTFYTSCTAHSDQFGVVRYSKLTQ